MVANSRMPGKTARRQLLPRAVRRKTRGPGPCPISPVSFPAVPSPQPLRHHVLRTLVLAGPMILSRVGLVTMSTTDIVVLGHVGSGELADYVLGSTIQESLTGMLVGLLLGVPVLVARETARGNSAAAGTIWRRGLVFAALAGLAMCLALQFAEHVYLLTGQDPELAARAARVTGLLACALPFIALSQVSTAFLESLHRPVVGLAIIALANIANLGLNIVLVLGIGPFPALGAAGCALATVGTAALAAGAGFLFIRFRLREAPGPGIGRDSARAVMVPRIREMTAIGLASGSSFFFEAASFTVMTLFVGRLGPVALAAQGVLFQFLIFSFMIAHGIAGATQVRVGNAWGRRDAAGIARAGWAGLALAMLFTSCVALGLTAFPEIPLRLFTSDPALTAVALPVLGWVALAMVFDGGQTVLNNTCRGRGDTWVPTCLVLMNYMGVMVPCAWLFTFAAGHGLPGIYQGILVASILSISVLALRFRALARRPAEAPDALRA